MVMSKTDEFRKDAVGIALINGLTPRQIADDLGVGFSTLNKWVTTHRAADVAQLRSARLHDRTNGFGARTGSSGTRKN